MQGDKVTATEIASGTVKRLHLGCGARFHPAWINVDLQPLDPSIVKHDVLTPLPFADVEFGAVYHAHLLEHLPRDRVPAFLRDCFRVLKPGGVLRVVVPDLEQIARLYLDSLQEAWDGDPEAQQRYRWAMLEMYDQVVRERPGGEMLAYLAQAADRPCDLAWYRIGADGRVIRRHLERVAPQPRPSLLARWLGWRERVIRWLLGDENKLLRIGRFRRAGEIHCWMYDRHSLRELLRAAGFTGFRVTGPADSDVAGWADHGLDLETDGSPSKPDSLYVEAVRP